MFKEELNLALGLQEKELGYDVTESERNFEKEGISGEVGQFSVEHNQYPQYCIMTENGRTMDTFQMTFHGCVGHP